MPSASARCATSVRRSSMIGRHALRVPSASPETIRQTFSTRLLSRRFRLPLPRREIHLLTLYTSSTPIFFPRRSRSRLQRASIARVASARYVGGCKCPCAKSCSMRNSKNQPLVAHKKILGELPPARRKWKRCRQPLASTAHELRARTTVARSACGPCSSLMRLSDRYYV